MLARSYLSILYVGLDWGGISREFFEMICVRCFDPSYELFMRFMDSPQSLVSDKNTTRYNAIVKAYYELTELLEVDIYMASFLFITECYIPT